MLFTIWLSFRMYTGISRFLGHGTALTPLTFNSTGQTSNSVKLGTLWSFFFGGGRGLAWPVGLVPPWHLGLNNMMAAPFISFTRFHESQTMLFRLPFLYMICTFLGMGN